MRIKMKMTQQEVANLMLNMNGDCSNVERYSTSEKKWEDIDTHDNCSQVLHGIALGHNYRIKDNSVKEVTLELLDKVVVSKDGKQKGRISFVHLGKEDWNPYVVIGQDGYYLEGLNKQWQLVED